MQTKQDCDNILTAAVSLYHVALLLLHVNLPLKMATAIFGPQLEITCNNLKCHWEF